MGRILIFVFLTGFFAAMMNTCTPRRSFSAKPHTGFETVNYVAERRCASRANRNATVSDGSAVELQRDSDGHSMPTCRSTERRFTCPVRRARPRSR